MNQLNEECYALGNYTMEDGHTRTLLGEVAYRYFYRKQWHLVDTLARGFKDYLDHSNLGEFDIVATLPLTMDNGYDPAILLTDWISNLTKIPNSPGLLKKVGQIPEFTSIQNQTLGSISVVDPEIVRGRRILFIEGVRGLDRSAAKATEALYQAGALKVVTLACVKLLVNSDEVPEF